MAINCFYLFARNGECLSYLEWNRPKPCTNPASEQKLLFGLLYSLKRFCELSSPISARKSPDFNFYTTSAYRLHFFESPSGLKFVLLSDPDRPISLREQLLTIYSYYVQYCAKNPLYQRGQVIHCDLFINAVKKYIGSYKTTGGSSTSSMDL